MLSAASPARLVLHSLLAASPAWLVLHSRSAASPAELVLRTLSLSSFVISARAALAVSSLHGYCLHGSTLAMAIAVTLYPTRNLQSLRAWQGLSARCKDAACMAARAVAIDVAPNHAPCVRAPAAVVKAAWLSTQAMAERASSHSGAFSNALLHRCCF